MRGQAGQVTLGFHRQARRVVSGSAIIYKLLRTYGNFPRFCCLRT
jgi:hypothetical protein